MRTSSDLRGMALAALAAFFWSSGFVAASYLLGGGAKRIDPLSLIALRFIIGGLVVFGFARARKKPLRLRNAGEWKLCLLVALFMYALVGIFFFLGQLSNTATVCALFIESGPVLLVAGWNLIRRKSSRIEIAAVSISLIGCLLVLNVVTATGIHYDFTLFWGQFALLLSAFFWVVGSDYAQKLMNSGGDKMVLTAWSEFLSGVMMLPLMLMFHSTLIVPTGGKTWLAILVMGVFPSGLAFIAWCYALSCSALWKLTLVQNLTPIFTMIGAALILGDRITGLNYIGIGIVFLGLLIAVAGGRMRGLPRRPPRPTPRA